MTGAKHIQKLYVSFGKTKKTLNFISTLIRFINCSEI